MSETLHPSLEGLSDCGCCAGPTAETPAEVTNREGLDRIAYRVGVHDSFKRSMLAALARSGRRALRGLNTRDGDDFSIALLDAWATTADVLTFYQERLVNEAFLRTALDPESVRLLARLIGYQPKPGVAAATWLAFTLDEAEGAPEELLVRSGTKAQSVPGQDEKAQTFETVEDVDADVAWNAMRPRVTRPQELTSGLKTLYLRGTATQLQKGDPVLIVGDERLLDPESGRWSFRFVAQVHPEPAQGWTRITLDRELKSSEIPAQNPRMYALRDRAALFGHNAPDPRLLISTRRQENRLIANGLLTSDGDWNGFAPGETIYLDGPYPKVISESWLVFSTPELDPAQLDLDGGLVALLLVLTGKNLVLRTKRVTFPSRTAFGLSGKVTRIEPDTKAHVGAGFPLRQTAVYVQSEELELSDAPLDEPLVGASITLDRKVPDLAAGRLLAVSGASTTGEDVSELVTVESSDGDPTTIQLAGAGLKHTYGRATVTIAGNVAPATHGETLEEIAGDGDGTRTFQHFPLRQPPLTYLRAHTPQGMSSTLEVRVEGILWHEVPSLYGRGPDERVYVTRHGEERTTVQFGDGLAGARLPTGEPVHVRYRKGGGLEGLVRAGQLTQLLSRPLGLTGVRNPLPAEGADEAESLSDARRNAPLGIRTLDRAVSLQDYEDFARAYPGVAKALATWTWDGRRRGVFLTVAGPDGAAVESDGIVAQGLLSSLRAAGDPFVPVRVETYRRREFEVAGRVVVHPEHDPDYVLEAVREAVQLHFSFAARAFGQPVTLSEVIAAMHAVPGVVAVDIDRFRRANQVHKLAALSLAIFPGAGKGSGGTPLRPARRADPAPRLLAELPGAGMDGSVRAAELLLLAHGSLERITAS